MEQFAETNRSVSMDGLDSNVAAIIGQYIEFMRRPAVAKTGFVDDKLIQEATIAIRTLVSEKPAGTDLTVVELWPVFLDRFPDHARALDGLYAGAKHYTAKTWFAFKIQRMAADRDLIEDTGRWQPSPGWGFPKVRVYCRLPSAQFD